MTYQWIKPASVLLIATAAALSGCKLPVIKGTPKTFLTYTDQAGQPQNLELQLMKPAKTAAPMANGLYPGIVFVHGGSWTAGSRIDIPLQNKIEEAANKGYVAISVDYRMIQLQTKDVFSSNINPWAVQIKDVKCAIRWMKANAAELKLDVNRIGVWGESAGGHLALMAGETTGSEYEASECTYATNSQVNAVVAYAPVTDFSATWKPSGTELNKAMLSLVAASEPSGSEYREYSQLSQATRAKMSDTSPINKISNVDVPVLLAHATDDDFVEPENSWNFYDSLIENHRNAYLLKLNRGWHFAGSDAPDAVRFANEQMYNWFGRHLKGENVTMACGDNTNCDVIVPHYE